MKITSEIRDRVEAQIASDLARYAQWGADRHEVIRRLWTAKAECIAEDMVLGIAQHQPRLEEWACLHMIILAGRDEVCATGALDRFTADLAATEPEPESVAAGQPFHMEPVPPGGQDDWDHADQVAEDRKHAGEQWPPGNGWPPDVAHDCGSAQDGPNGANTYPARIFVLQRDPDDPESWVLRCAEDHTDPPLMAIITGTTEGWRSPDYASEDDALIAAKDHARVMHDMALPNAIRDRADAAERAAAERMAP